MSTRLKYVTLAFGLAFMGSAAQAQTAAPAAGAAKKPNILVIWGDDIGQDNISAYHRGLMGISANLL